MRGAGGPGRRWSIARVAAAAGTTTGTGADPGASADTTPVDCSVGRACSSRRVRGAKEGGMAPAGAGTVAGSGGADAGTPADEEDGEADDVELPPDPPWRATLSVR